MHSAAPQIRPRPDSASSRPASSAVSACEVRSTRSCTCGTVALSTSSRMPPKANMPSRSEEHTSELQSLMRISYAVFCLKKKKTHNHKHKLYSEHHKT